MSVVVGQRYEGVNLIIKRITGIRFAVKQRITKPNFVELTGILNKWNFKELSMFKKRKYSPTLTNLKAIHAKNNI